MFLCPECHGKTKCQRGAWEEMMGSHGPCEKCHKVADCMDCHGY